MAPQIGKGGIVMGTVDWALADLQLWKVGIIVFLILGLSLWISTWARPYSKFPIVNLEPTRFPYFWPSKHQWAYRTPDVIAKGKEMTNSCFQVRTMSGYKILIPRRFANELRHNEALNFRTHTRKDIQTHLSGMDAMSEALRLDGLFAETVRIKFTQALATVLPDMVEEGAYAVSVEFGESTEWKTSCIKEALYFTVSRTSTRIYTGKEMARDEKWLKLVLDYTLGFLQVMQFMPLWPSAIRPFVHLCTSRSRKLNAMLREAEQILNPIISETKKHRISSDDPAKKKHAVGKNAFEWMLDVQNERKLDMKNLVSGQLGLSLIATQSSTEVLSRALVKIAEDPKLLSNLREEIVRTLQLEGWTKMALYKMELMESFLHEVLRMYPMAYTSMARHVSKEVVLSDGTVLPAGSATQLIDDGPEDSSVYDNPHLFDPYRTLRKRREPGEKNRHQFVSTTSDVLIFGLGEYACPGRFFAAQELKILLAHLIMNYDWQSVGQPLKLMCFESVQFFPPTTQVKWRRRTETEIDMANPKVVKQGS